MIIRKKFKFEGAHIVRDCSSDLCKKSIHGHSYIVEVFFTSRGLDNGQMVVDFGLLKGNIKELIESFDHAYSMWDKEAPHFQDFMKENSERWIKMPVSPSAEMYSLMFFYILDKMIENTVFNNGEKGVRLHSVRVHETETGYAESFNGDLGMWDFDLDDIIFSDGIKKDWTNPEMFEDLKKHKKFINPKIDRLYV